MLLDQFGIFVVVIDIIRHFSTLIQF